MKTLIRTALALACLPSALAVAAWLATDPQRRQPLLDFVVGFNLLSVMEPVLTAKYLAVVFGL